MSSPESLTHRWLRHQSASYPSHERVFADLAPALLAFPTVRPKSDIYTYDDGRTQLLLCLHGLLPITFRSATYNIPIALWITRDYPREPPIVYVVPTGDMLVRPSRHVDVSGRCTIEYMHNWLRKSEGCNVVALLEALQAHFSREPPLYAKPREHTQSPRSSTPIASTSAVPAAAAAASHYAAKPPPPLPMQMQMQTQGQPSQVAAPSTSSPLPPERPPLPPKPSAAADHIRNNTQSIHPVGPYHADNTRTEFSSANPSFEHQSNTYNPSSPTRTIPAPVGTPSTQSPPPPPPPPPLPPLAPPNPSGYGVPSHLPASQPSMAHNISPPPVPQPPPVHQPQSIVPPIPMQHVIVAPSPVSAPPAPAPNLMDEELPEPQAPSQFPNLVTPESRPPRPPNPELLQLHAKVQEKISIELDSLTQALAADAERLRAIQTDLLAGEPAIKDEMARLEAVRGVCRNVADRLRGPVGLAESNVSELRRKGDPEVDELVCATNIVHNQLIDLVAEDNAIEDTIYHLHRALNTGRIDLERFLRTTRALAEEQFMKRALIEKIQQGISKSLNSSTHDQGGWYWT
ncbi:hypothetical protein AX16_003756 [Volvariella volvacea WC 439]|nr:hypothetical protein AX16_003756 [Volvariella volvacea WC 439]